MQYVEMAPELLAQVNAILQRDIDPIYFEVAKIIAPEMEHPQYIPWLLAHKMPPEGCRVLLELPDKGWRPELGEYGVSDEFKAEMKEKFGIEPEFTAHQVEDSFFNGDVYFNPEKGPMVTPNRGLWIDIQNGDRCRDRNGPAYYKILGIMLEQEYSPLMEQDADRRALKGVQGMGRIIPRYDSVKDCPDLLPAENYKEILRTRDIISQNRCACRERYPEYGQDLKVCFSSNRTARMAIKKELGHEISWEEAFDYVQKAGKKAPLCHINKHCMDLDGLGDILCNCNANACAVMRHTVNTGGLHKVWEYYHKSRFRAVIDPEKCIGCGLCRDKRCMFDAIHKKYLREQGVEGLCVDEELCMGCGCCAETCPAGAIKMRLVDPPEALLGYVVGRDGKVILPESEQKSEEKKDGAFDPFNQAG